MERGSKWPKAIFYDSKTTLFDWKPVWIKASSNILKKYGSNIDPEEFWKTWIYFDTGENHRTAFGEYREFTEVLKASLAHTFMYYGIRGDPDDARFVNDLWDEVLPFPTISRRAEINQLLNASAAN